MAYEQFPLNIIKRSIPLLITTKTPTVSEVGAKIIVTGADFTIIFDKEIGTISSFVKQGISLIKKVQFLIFGVRQMIIIMVQVRKINQGFG